MKTLVKHTAEEMELVHTLLGKALDILNPERETLSNLSREGYDEILNLELLSLAVFSEGRKLYNKERIKE